MSRASSIDVYQADRGLATCFEAANIEAAWRDEFLHKHRIQTLDDFVYMVTHGEWERSLTELVDSCSGLKSNRVILSRFKAAWESGSAAVKQAAQPASKGAADQLDEMLPESTLATVSRDFRTRYSLEIHYLFTVGYNLLSVQGTLTSVVLSHIFYAHPTVTHCYLVTMLTVRVVCSRNMLSIP